MCGLVGVFGNNLTQTEIDAFELLLKLDTLRGPHSTGVFFCNHKRHKVLKKIGMPWSLMNTKEYRETKKDFKTVKLLLGHNRFATKGEVTSRNAHPFSKGHITLVHNGTIHTEYRLEKNLDNKYSFDTDSELAAAHISEKGIEETWSSLSGGTAFIWWDNKSKTLNWIRNSHRPLHFIFSKGRRTLFFASEKWMLKAIVSTFNIEVEENTYWYPSVDTLFSYSVSEKGVKEKETKKLKAFTYQSSYHYGREYGELWGSGWYDRNENKSDTVGIKVWDYKTQQWVDKKATTGLSKSVKSEDKYEADSLGYITPSSWRQYLKKEIDEETFHKQYHTCCLCNNEFTKVHASYKDSIIVDSYHAVCDSCGIVAEEQGIGLLSLLS